MGGAMVTAVEELALINEDALLLRQLVSMTGRTKSEIVAEAIRAHLKLLLEADGDGNFDGRERNVVAELFPDILENP